MLAKEEKALLKKIAPVVSRLLKALDDRWTGIEISQATGIPTSRVSEYRNQTRVISFDNLIRLTGGGIVTMEEIVKMAGGKLSKKEAGYLMDISFVENPQFRRLAVKNKQRGVDQLELQALVNKLLDQGVDVLGTLKEMKKL